MVKPPIHVNVQPFSLYIKPTCMQPPIFHHTQSRGLDHSRYFCVARIVRQCQPSPLPSVSSSRYKQCWQSSLYDTRHPSCYASTVTSPTNVVCASTLFCALTVFVHAWTVLAHALTGPHSCIDGPRSCFDAPHSCFDASRSCSDGRHSQLP